MNLFRRLTADVPGELLSAQVAVTSRAAESAIAGAPHEMTTDPYDLVFAILGVLADNPGVLTADTPGLPTPAYPTGEN